MKSDETVIILSEDEEEWYCQTYTCSSCGCNFMTNNPGFCPGCGKKIVGEKQEGMTIYNLEGKVQEENGIHEN